MLTFITIFIVGVACGVCAVFQWALIAARRHDKQVRAQLAKSQDEATEKFLQELARQKALLAAPPPPPNPADTVKERLRKAVELTLKQQKLDTRVSDENLILHNELELEKLVILRSILNDGFDPPITVRYNTGDEEQALSAYVARIQKGLN